MTSASRLAALGTATLGEAAPESRLLRAPLRPLEMGMRAAGPARTVRCPPGDNLALHRAIAIAEAGDMIVADCGGSTGNGPFGEIMALACQLRGVAGLVIDGAVRDSAEIIELGFPVFARGLNIRGTTKGDEGELDIPLEIGGAKILPGDIVVADSDAILVLPAAIRGTALKQAEARARREENVMQRLRAGETTLQILGLDKEKSI